jgi:uncharacterized protein
MTKWLLIIAIVWIAYMLWRKGQAGASPRQGSAASTGQPQDMVCCPVCSVHLPRADALAGPDGRLYCSQEHRLQAAGR